MRASLSWLTVTLVLIGCDRAPDDPYPVYDSAELQLGREVWLANCQVCHGTGLADAPRFGDRAAWAPRIGQGMDTLYTHALQGFAGRTGSEMPARGGNPDLGDAEVKAAVQYMIEASR